MLFLHDIKLTMEERKYVEQIYLLFENDTHSYCLWFEPDEDTKITELDKENKLKIQEYVKEMSLPMLTQTSRLFGMTAFHHLVMKNMREEVKSLLEQGVDPNLRCVHTMGSPASYIYKDVTALHIACMFGNYEMAKLLLEYGADDSLVDSKGRTCFHYLAGKIKDFIGDNVQNEEVTQQRVKIAKLLKTDVNQKDEEEILPFVDLFRNDNEESALPMIQAYLEQGMDACLQSKNGITPLMQAIMMGSSAAAIHLIGQGRGLDIQSSEGHTAAHLTLNSRQDILLYLLCEKGANLDLKDNDDESVRDILTRWDWDHYNSMLKEEKTLEDYYNIAERGISYWNLHQGRSTSDFAIELMIRKFLHHIDKKNTTEVQYIYELLHHQDKNIATTVRILYEEGFTFDTPLVRYEKMTTLRDVILEKGEWSTVVPKLIECGADMENAYCGGITPAYVIISHMKNNRKGAEEEVLATLEYLEPETFTAISESGASALHVLATVDNCYPLMKAVANHGVDLDVAAEEPAKPGDTPLHVACRTHHEEAVKALIEEGADDTLSNEDGNTPAHCLFGSWSIREHGEYQDTTHGGGKIENILKLLRHIDCANENTGATPAMNMAKANCVTEEILDVFLDEGIDINHSDDEGNTLLLWMTRRGIDSSYVKLLYKEGADINAKNQDGYTPLFYAIEDGDIELARYLVKKGADYNIANHKRETPAGLATKKGMDEVLELMTDIQMIDTSDEEDTSLTEKEKQEAWEEDYWADEDYDDEEDYDEEDEDEEDLIADTWDPDLVRDYEALEKTYAQSVGPEHAKEMVECLKKADALYDENGNLYIWDLEKRNEYYQEIQRIGFTYSKGK